jgi:membrane-associated phospholipid phosphatase
MGHFRGPLAAAARAALRGGGSTGCTVANARILGARGRNGCAGTDPVDDQVLRSGRGERELVGERDGHGIAGAASLVSGVGLGAMVVGAAVLAGSLVGARGATIPAAEQRAFRAVNGLPDALFVPLWLPMQLGNLVVGTVAGLLAALLLGEWRLAAAVVVAVALKVVVEHLVRRWMAGHLTVRQRPGTSEPAAVRRGDVPEVGPSFPSGHVILVAAVTCTVVDLLPAVWGWTLFGLPLLVMVGRVYVGAHNPLDVTAGLGAGLLVGGLVAMVLG